MKLSIKDLKPKEATFKLDSYPGVTFTLKKFSLNAQLWMSEQFGDENVQGIFEQQKLKEISHLAFFLLKDKSVLPTLEAFREAVTSHEDRAGMLMALLETIGISQPIIDELAKELEGNADAPAELPTGAKSTT